MQVMLKGANSIRAGLERLCDRTEMQQGMRLVKWNLARKEQQARLQAFCPLPHAGPDLMYSMAKTPVHRIELDAEGMPLVGQQGLELLARLENGRVTKSWVVWWHDCGMK